MVVLGVVITVLICDLNGDRRGGRKDDLLVDGLSIIDTLNAILARKTIDRDDLEAKRDSMVMLGLMYREIRLILLRFFSRDFALLSRNLASLIC